MSSTDKHEQAKVEDVLPGNNPPPGLQEGSPEDNPPPANRDVPADNPPSNIQEEAAKPKDPDDTDSDIEVLPYDPEEQLAASGYDPYEPELLAADIGNYSHSAPSRLVTHPYITPPYRIGEDGHPIFPYTCLSERMRLERVNNPTPPPPPEPKDEDESDSTFTPSPSDDYPDTKCQFLDDEPLD